MVLFEQKINDELFNRLSFIYDDLDIQWWLYRGSLSRQSLGVEYYKTWLKYYNMFISIFKDIFSKDSNDFYKNIKDLDNLKACVISERDKVKSVLYNKPYNEFNTCIDKICKYIDKIIDVLRAEDE